jgi:hypothetical protein
MTKGRSDRPGDRSGLPRERIGRDRIAEREPVLRIEPVLVLGSGAFRHTKAVVGEHLARTRDVAHHTVEDPPPTPVVVHAELEKVAQKTAALRDAKGERMANAGTLGPRALRR